MLAGDLPLFGDAGMDRVAQSGVGHELRVAGCDAEIGLGEDHVEIGKHGLEERPALIHLAQLSDAAALLVKPLRYRGTESVPAGQHDAALAPAEYPGDRPKILE